MFQPDKPARPFAPASVERPGAAAVRPAAGQTGSSSAFTLLQREIGNIVQNGFAGTRSSAALSAQAAQSVTMQRALTGAGTREAAGVQTGAVLLDALASAGSLGSSRQAFLADILPHARRAGAALGLSPDVIAAHAALESGWGQRPLKDARGVTTHNVFGLKATGSWRGAVAEAATTEYIRGEAIKTVEQFRAYPDYASAFRDYVSLLRDTPRYAAALNQGDDARAFAHALKRGGYATDPAYENKLAQVAEQIQSALR